jgi:hypothetical protein
VVRTDLGVDEPLPADADLVLIGDDTSEERFLNRHVARDGPSRWQRWARSLGSRR